MQARDVCSWLRGKKEEKQTPESEENKTIPSVRVSEEPDSEAEDKQKLRARRLELGRERKKGREEVDVYLPSFRMVGLPSDWRFRATICEPKSHATTGQKLLLASLVPATQKEEKSGGGKKRRKNEKEKRTQRREMDTLGRPRWMDRSSEKDRHVDT